MKPIRQAFCGTFKPQHSHRPIILCIDDDPEITRSIEILLSNYDVDVVCDCCGRLGAWDVVDARPDLVITDLRMPHGDGQHLLEVIKGNTETAHIPVLVLTGQRDEQLAGRLKSLGAAGLLWKPVACSRLISEIGRHVHLSEWDWTTVDFRDVR